MYILIRAKSHAELRGKVLKVFGKETHASDIPHHLLSPARQLTERFCFLKIFGRTK